MVEKRTSAATMGADMNSDVGAKHRKLDTQNYFINTQDLLDNDDIIVPDSDDDVFEKEEEETNRQALVSINANEKMSDMVLPFNPSTTVDETRERYFNSVVAQAIRLVPENPNCIVLVYKKLKTQDPWTEIERKAESENNRLKFENLPKGVFFKITDISLIDTGKYERKSYVATLHNTFGVFLPTRFTAEIQHLGREGFLKERPHLSYVGVNETNSANVVLIFKLRDLYKPKTWANIKEYYIQYKIINS